MPDCNRRLLIACMLTLPIANSAAQFTSVYTVPDDAPPRLIGSDTQVNIISGGAVGFSPDPWVLGDDDQSSTNIEVNLGLGGRVEGDVVLNSGAQLNVNSFYGFVDGNVVLNGNSILRVDMGWLGFSVDGYVTGDIVVGDGALFELKSSSSLSPADVYIADGGTLLVTGSGSVNEVTVEAGGQIDFGGAYLGTLNAIQLTLAEGTSLTTSSGSHIRSNVDVLNGAMLKNSGTLGRREQTTTVHSGAVLELDSNSKAYNVDVLAGGAAQLAGGVDTVHARAGSIVNATGLNFWLGYPDVQVEAGAAVSLSDSNAAIHLADEASVGVEGGRSILHAGQSSQSTFTGGVVSAKLESGASVTTAGSQTQFALDPGATLRVDGGLLHNKNWSAAGSTPILVGAEFRIDGVPVTGLSNLGDRVDLAVSSGQVIQGVLAGGVPFELSPTRGDQIESISFELADLPPVTNGEVLTPGTGDTVPLGVRRGQTLVLNPGKRLPSGFRAEAGSVVTIQPSTGYYYSASSYPFNGETTRFGGIESYGATFNVSASTRPGSFYDGSVLNLKTGGSFRERVEFFNGSTLNVEGGTTPPRHYEYQVFEPIGTYLNGSTLNLTSGKVTYAWLVEGSVANISGGTAVDIDLLDSRINIAKGTVTSLTAAASKVTMSGGSLDALTVDESSQLHLYGSEFLIDGTPIPDLAPGDQLVINASTLSTLSGILVSGDYFAFDLPASPTGNDTISPDALLTVTLVGDPGDYNFDGVVNAADYTVWRDAFERGEASPDYSHADGDFNGVVDERDREVWAARYGNESSSTPSSTVPEPAAALLTAFAALAGVSRRLPQLRR